MLYQSDTLSLNWIEEGIAELVFNAPGPINKLDIATINSLDTAVKIAAQHSSLKGVLLSSRKAAFIVGADINEFHSLFALPPEELMKWLTFANSIFSRLEDLPVPTLSAINGYALGGGCECILATDFRIAAPDARIGLPETKLGIIPGFGGTVRLPRLLGADNAMEIIATGKNLTAHDALKIGLVDAVVEQAQLHDSARSMLHAAIRGELDWSVRRKVKQTPLKLSKIEATMSFNTAKAQVLLTAGGHYPAPLKAVETISRTAPLNRDEAIVFESRTLTTLASSQQAQALTGIYINDHYVKNKAKKLTSDVTLPQKIAILGAGIMGGGIACLAASKGVPVLMKDINSAALELGINEAAILLNKQLIRGKINGVKLATTISHINTTLNYAGFDEADIVVEAVVEDPEIKNKVFTETEACLKEDAILVSNTSSIPITVLARALKKPEQFCGMHFFNPVHRMPLVEVIRGEKTADSTIARVMAWSCEMGKVPVIVNDCPGFFVNRVLLPYLAGFSFLVRDGADFRQIDRVMEQQFGGPMGPAKLLDVIGTMHNR